MSIPRRQFVCRVPSPPAFDPFFLQKVIRQHALLLGLVAARLQLLDLVVLGRGSKDVEEALARVADLEHARHVAAAVAVVGRAPHRAQPVVVEHLVALLAELMRAQDVVHVVDGEKLLDDLGAKRVAGAAGREAELVAVRVRVGPDEVRHGPFVGDFAEAVDDLDLVDGVDRGGEAWLDMALAGG
jgi:hypothetical protein